MVTDPVPHIQTAVPDGISVAGELPAIAESLDAAAPGAADRSGSTPRSAPGGPSAGARELQSAIQRGDRRSATTIATATVAARGLGQRLVDVLIATTMLLLLAMVKSTAGEQDAERSRGQQIAVLRPLARLLSIGWDAVSGSASTRP